MNMINAKHVCTKIGIIKCILTPSNQMTLPINIMFLPEGNM